MGRGIKERRSPFNNRNPQQRLDQILENNRDVDLLTIGYYLINQYESRNEKE